MPIIPEHVSLFKRDVSNDVVHNLTPTKDEKITLGLVGVYIFVILLLWRMPFLNKILYPFKVSPCFVIKKLFIFIYSYFIYNIFF